MNALVFRSFLLRGFMGALLINILLFASLPGLISVEGSKDSDLESLNTVQITRIKPELPPPPKEKPKEKEPEKEPEKIFKISKPKLGKPRPDKLKMNLPAMDLNIDPRISGGIPVVAPPPALPPAQDEGPDFNSIIAQEQLDTIPVPSYKTNPKYPYRAKRLGINGEVKIKFLVDKEGVVSRISIIEANPPDIFNQSVLDAVSSWKYSPGELLGRKVATYVTTTIIFQMEGQ